MVLITVCDRWGVTPFHNFALEISTGSSKGV